MEYDRYCENKKSKLIIEGRNMELHQLESFVEMTEELNFSKAAKKMHITQSTMSIRIQSLEKELGVPLFSRSGREICLSPFGELLLPYAKKCLNAIEEIKQKIQEKKEATNNTIRIGISNPFATSLLPNLLPDIYRAFPNLDIQVLRPERSLTIVKMIKESKCDIGIINNIELLDPLETKEVVHIPLLESPIVLVCSYAHSFSKYDQIPASLLADQQLISLSSTTVSSKLVHSYFEREQVTPVFNMEINNVEAILRLINTEPFLTLLPDQYLKNSFNAGNLTSINMSPKPPSLVISIVYMPDTRFQKLANFIKNKVDTLHLER
jgi:DNA-binding transcriptional LysR family regulator